jgi:hypothetical protein
LVPDTTSFHSHKTTANKGFLPTFPAIAHR